MSPRQDSIQAATPHLPAPGRDRGQQPAAETGIGFHESRGRAHFMTLSVRDLVPDDNGAVVIETGGEVLVVELTHFQNVLRRGIAPEGTLTQHFDVSGMDFCRLAGGIVVYFRAENVRLVLAP